jgi:hypothetical protein
MYIGSNFGPWASTLEVHYYATLQLSLCNNLTNMEKYYLYCFEFPTKNALLAITEAL